MDIDFMETKHLSMRWCLRQAKNYPLIRERSLKQPYFLGIETAKIPFSKEGINYHEICEINGRRSLI
jgi:hypothetical protein